MNDVGAIALADRVLLGESPAVRQFVRTVARHETGYSEGWARKGITPNPQNYGAVTAHAEPWFEHPDPIPANPGRVQRFKRYASAELGFQDAAREVLRHPGVREALERGDGAEAVRAMARGGYFEAPPAQYIAAMGRNYVQMIGNTGERAELRFADSVFPGTAQESGGGLLLLVLVLGWILYRVSGSEEQNNGNQRA